MAIRFLTFVEVLEIHRDQIERYGGRSGIRDEGLLHSALGMPPATYEGRFLHADIAEMAAAYLFHLIMNHPFIDGNKRVGAVAAILFLEFNGHEITVSEDDLFDWVVGVAQGRREKAEVTELIRLWARPVEK